MCLKYLRAFSLLASGSRFQTLNSTRANYFGHISYSYSGWKLSMILKCSLYEQDLIQRGKT